MILRISLLFLLSQAADSAGYGSCPYGCECIPHHSVPSAWQATCSWDALSQGSPFIHSSGIRSLSISCRTGNAAALTGASFKGLEDLHELRIERCGISKIEPSAFDPLKALRELHMNEISSPDSSLVIPEEALLPLSKLQKLYLTDSGLQSLPSTLFCRLAGLQMLNISGNALKESALSTNSACSAAALIIVDLSRNAIQEVMANSFDAFPVVRQLLLGRNGMTSMHSGAFNRTKLLQNIGLEGNALTSLGELPETVVSINAAGNKLAVLPPSIARLPSLVHLNLSANALTSPLPNLTTTDLDTLDLSHNRLSELPELSNASAKLVSLSVAHNKIASLGDGGLAGYGSLATLDLSSNALSSIEEGSLSPLPSLTQLNLANNSIGAIAPGALHDLSLDRLDLSRNQLEKVPQSLLRLRRCETVDLSRNAITSISHLIFSRVKDLKELDLSGNKLDKLDHHEISDCPHLTTVRLGRNLIRDVHERAFDKCDSLRRLDLSANRLASISLPRSLNTLKALNLSSNLLAELNWDGLPINIESLALDHNRISSLRGSPAHHRTRHLSLAHNLLSSLASGLLPDALESLNLALNSISALAPSTFAAKAALTKVDLSSNLLRSLPFDSVHVPDVVTPVKVLLGGNPLACTCELDWIKVQSTLGTKAQIAVVDGATAECTHVMDGRRMALASVDRTDLLCNYTKTCEPGCQCCQFGSCDCHAICPPGCECWRDGAYGTNIVRCTGLRGKAAEKFTVRELPQSATHIYISDFPLPTLVKHSVISRTRLVSLRINGTGMRAVEPMAFNKAPNLKMLDLSNNALSSFAPESLHRTGAITHLFLNDNRIGDVEGELLKKLPDLEALTLHGNALKDVPSGLAGLKQVTLAGNAFRCDCDLDRWAATRFVAEHSTLIADISRVQCVENTTAAFRTNDTTILSAFPPNRGEDLFEMSMTEFIRDVNTSICVPIKRSLFGTEGETRVLIGVLIFFVIVIVGACLCFLVAAIRRSRCGLRSKRYKLNSSLNCSTTPGTSPLPDPLLHHDIFVSYAKRDEKVVHEMLVRRLEHDNFSVCMLHRDGPKYDTMRHAVSDELIRMMSSAKMIILVISRAYLEEEWKQFCVLHSHKLVCKEKSPLMTIYLDDVDRNKIDTELGTIIRRNPQLKLNDHLFENMLLNQLNQIEGSNTPTFSESNEADYSEMYAGRESMMV